jgi:hypothetical protein
MRLPAVARLRYLVKVPRGIGGVWLPRNLRRSWLTFWLVLVVVALAARVAHPHVRPASFAIVCDGIDDEDGGSFWSIAKTKKDEATARPEMRTQTIPRERELASVYARASGQRDNAVRPTSLLFRPRLFAARPTARTDSANPG